MLAAFFMIMIPSIIDYPIRLLISKVAHARVFLKYSNIQHRGVQKAGEQPRYNACHEFAIFYGRNVYDLDLSSLGVENI